MLSELVFVDNSYSWEVTAGLAIAGFALGLIFKSSVIYKQRKRILQLEDEMLSNHSRILSLEKRIAEHKAEKNNTHQDYELHITKEREVKAS